jgi:ADP-ribose pyrophosphatase
MVVMPFIIIFAHPLKKDLNLISESICMPKAPWKLISRKIIYRFGFGRDIHLRVDKVDIGKKMHKFIYLNNPYGVLVAALTRDKKIILLRQYRYTINKYLWEIPAGYPEKNESLEQCAKRELLEETGYEARKIKKIYSYYASQGISNHKINVFLATDLKKKKTRLEDTEIIETRLVDIKKAVKWVFDNKIQSHDALCILVAYNLLNNGKITL